jgi:hypothetical protein
MRLVILKAKSGKAEVLVIPHRALIVLFSEEQVVAVAASLTKQLHVDACWRDNRKIQMHVNLFVKEYALEKYERVWCGSVGGYL